MIVLGLRAALLAMVLTPMAGAFHIGFTDASQLFECLPGDEVHFQALGSSGDDGMMRWRIDRDAGGMRAAVRPLEPGVLAGLDRLRFQLRSDRPGSLWLQLDEADGEGWYTTLETSTGWETVSLALADLKSNGEGAGDGRFDLAKLNKILLLDASGGAGIRNVWLSGFEFVSGRRPYLARRGEQRERVEGPRYPRLETGKVGISAIPRNWSGTRKAALEVIRRARLTGAQVLVGGNTQWTDEVEPSPGVFDWSAPDRFFAALDDEGWDPEYAYDLGGIFFHDRHQTPSHVEYDGLTDGEFRRRYLAFVRSFLDRFGERVTYLILHAEGATSYFRTHPERLEDFCGLLAEVRALAREHHPDLKVGVNTDPENEDRVLAAFARVVDFVGYDVSRLDSIPRPDRLGDAMQRLIRLAGEKKIAVVNGGWSTSHVDQSDEAQQSDFVRHFYRALGRHRESIEFASFYTLFDDDLEVMRPVYRALFPDYPEDFVEKMVQVLGRSGLFRPDDTPKPAWPVLLEEIAAYHRKD